MKTIYLFIIAAFLTLSANARVVTDQKGRKADLKLLGWNGELVKVQNKAGKTNTLRIAMLSERDQKHVRENVKKDLSIAERIPRRSYRTTNGKSFEADLIGLRGEMVELHSTAGDRQVQLPISYFAKADQDYIVEHAPLLDSLNANPEVRHSPIMLKEAVGKIDQMMDRWYQQQKVTPNAIVDDGTFLRRAYLTVIGRVPTQEEAKAFLDDRDINRREKLIDSLFEHDGYVHHMFNYYADLLRIRSRNPGRNYGGAYYAQWVKDSVRENRPYDHFVQDLLTASGYYWENPAVGFYRRDPNMPLDNLAVMTQTLLGTSIVCAQCHDHPFDKWTQKEYYEMAAYTYPMVTRMNAKEHSNVREAQKIMVSHMGKAGLREFDREHRRVRQNMIDYPLQSGAKESDRRLKFPKDYAYGNAKPNSLVPPSTPFGPEANVALKGKSTIAPFVKWFTSPENPRFAKNISNRLWKEAFGLGLVEPVDDIKESSQAFNPELMDFMTKLLVSLEFDTKTYLKVLMKTQLFAREVYREEVNPVDGYSFTGPLLRRMTAEQIWDSVLTMILPDVDHRLNASLMRQDTAIAEQGKETLKMKPQEIYVSLMAKAGVENPKGVNPSMMAKMEGSMEMMSMNGKYNSKKPQDNLTEKQKAQMAKMDKRQRKKFIDQLRREKDPWYAFDRSFYRAAEQPSPAPAGSFLSMFGQSDRAQTENDNQEASIPQVLTLMNNSKMLDYMLTRPQSVMYKNLAAASTPKEKVEAIFLCTYSRYPTPAELDVMTKEVAEGPAGIKRVLWAVFNSQPYRFVQ